MKNSKIYNGVLSPYSQAADSMVRALRGGGGMVTRFVLEIMVETF